MMRIFKKLIKNRIKYVTLCLDSKSYFLKIQKKANIKKIILKVESKTKLILVSCPLSCNFDEAVLIVKNNIEFVDKQLNTKKYVNFAEMKFVYILGEKYSIEVNIDSSYKQTKFKVILNTIIINTYLMQNSLELEKKFIKFIKDTIAKTITNLVEEKIEVLNDYILDKKKIKYNKISIKDLKSKWGSCSSSCNLSFNFKLALAPIVVLDYVVAHEVAHLLHFNHSKEFWETCNGLSKNMVFAKAFLKQNAKYIFLNDLEKIYEDTN